MSRFPAAVRAAAAANTEVKLAGGLTATDARIIAPDMRTDVDFLLSIAKHEDGTEFACHVQNELQRAVRLTIPFGQLEADPRRSHDGAALRAVLAADPVPRTAEAPVAATPKVSPSPEPQIKFPSEWDT